MIVRPLSTVDNTRDYARVSHRQWSNYYTNHRDMTSRLSDLLVILRRDLLQHQHQHQVYVQTSLSST